MSIEHTFLRPNGDKCALSYCAKCLAAVSLTDITDIPDLTDIPDITNASAVEQYKETIKNNLCTCPSVIQCGDVLVNTNAYRGSGNFVKTVDGWISLEQDEDLEGNGLIPKLVTCHIENPLTFFHDVL